MSYGAAEDRSRLPGGLASDRSNGFTSCSSVTTTGNNNSTISMGESFYKNVLVKQFEASKDQKEQEGSNCES